MSVRTKETTHTTVLRLRTGAMMRECEDPQATRCGVHLATAKSVRLRIEDGA
jgi:hypothetical protein